MNNQKQQENISENILKRIKSGEIKMKPRWIFILKTLFVVSLAIFAFLLMIFLASLIHFILFASGALFLPDFGLIGFPFFAIAFPWPILFAFVIFLAIFAVIVWQFPVVYRRPAAWGFIMILIFSFLGALAIHQLHIHDKLFKYSQKGNPMLMGPLYKGMCHMPPGAALVGKISSTTSHGYILNDENQGSCSVWVSDKTSFPKGRNIQTGDAVMSIGKGECDHFNATGIRKIQRDDGPLWHVEK